MLESKVIFSKVAVFVMVLITPFFVPGFSHTAFRSLSQTAGWLLFAVPHATLTVPQVR